MIKNNLILFLFLLTQQVFAQSYNWITPNKTYLKLYVIQDGIYRINKNDFTQAGINTSSIDPRTVKVYYKGSQVPIYFEGEQDGSFDNQDFLDFYGHRNYGGLTNTYRDSSGNNVVHYVTDEYYNIYSDTSVYWIGWDGEIGLRYTLKGDPIMQQYQPNFHYRVLHFERDIFYDLGETTNRNYDFRYFNTEKVSGEGWFQNILSPSTGYIVNETFSTPYLQSGSQLCYLKIFAYPGSRDTSFNEHRLILKINSTTVSTLLRNDYQRFDTTITFQSDLLNNSSVNTLTIQYSPAFSNQNATPVLYFDCSQIKYPAKFSFDSSRAKIILDVSDTSRKTFYLSSFNVNQPVYIYDIRNNIKITSYSSNADTLSFTGKSNGIYEVVNTNIDKKPFRILAKQVPDFISVSNSANYIIIYNRLFTNAAENLKQHRQTFDNLTSFKAAADDIIDVFNFGMEDPVAIRRFIDYVYRYWQPPRLSYVCLLGRGSLDPKHNLSSSIWYKNLIPVYGNPPSDGYFATNNFGGFTYYRKVAIGRIPAYTEQEANDITNKIISYDNLRTNPEHWWKTFIMITGGANRSQQEQYQVQSNNFIQTYVSPPPLSCSPHRIYRNDSLGYITYNYKDSIKHEIDRGSLIINFIGHAANQDWEIGLEDVNTLENGYKLPLVFSMTCFTGKNAETSWRGFGEQFLYLNNKGSIGFISSTGWSFASQGNILNGYMFEAVAHDTLRRIGDILKFGSARLAGDSLNFASRNTVNSYDLLGDPATKLLLPAFPEFVIHNQDYKLSNPYPLTGETVTLKIFPKNYGLHADFCLTRFEILKNGVQFRTRDTLRSNFGFLDTLSYTFRLDTIGNYVLKATLDYDNRYPQEDPANNIIIIPLPLRNTSYTPLKPVNNAALNTTNVEFVGLNPQVDRTTNSLTVLLQVDTNKAFISPLFNFSTSGISGVVTRAYYTLPSQDTSIVYYWRTNSIINNDSIGWSPVYKFTYNPQISGTSAKLNKTIHRNERIFQPAYDSVVHIYTKKPGQYEPNELNGVNYNGEGFTLNNFTGTLMSYSYGSNGYQASYFIINNIQIYADGGGNTGLNMAQVSRLTGKLRQFKNFRMNSPQSSDSVLSFLNSFDSTYYLMIFVASHVQNSDSLRQNARNRIKEFGSFYADSLRRFDEFDSWAFIGYLGASQQNISEQFYNYPTPGCPDYWCPSIAVLHPQFLHSDGSLLVTITPSHTWKYFDWNGEVFTNSTIKNDIYGINRAQQIQLLRGDLTYNLILLDTLSSYAYPGLQIITKLSIDSLSGINSPVFRSFHMKYVPPAELVPDNFSIQKSDSVYNEGEDASINLKNYNVGYVPVTAHINKWTANTYSGIITLKEDTVWNPLLIDSSRTESITFSTTGLRNRQKIRDTVGIFYETSILGNYNDYFPFNNFAYTQIIITGDSVGPSIEVTFDGERILNGDYVRARPDILFKFYDQTQINYTLNDTAYIRIKLDSTWINYTLNGNPNPQITFEAVNQNDLKTIVRFNPLLSEGIHNFVFTGKDKDNRMDTVKYTVNVTYALKIRYLYNYPNPMTNDTWFTYELLGENQPTNCRIKIYTVAGRMIKELSFPSRIGFNHVYWDGRDNDDEIIANGVYLYKLIIEDAGNTQTAIQKLAIIK
jgi:hypothetical protein